MGGGEGTTILNITEIIIFTSCNHTGLVLTQSYFHEEIFVFFSSEVFNFKIIVHCSRNMQITSYENHS